MKFLIVSAMLLSFGANGAVEYESNDGSTPPGTFSEKSSDSGVKTTTIQKEEAAPAMKNETEVQSSGISTEDVNTSPNRAPSTDEEVIEDTALSNEGVDEDSVMEAEEAREEDDLMEAQEAQEGEVEDTIDYSTLPEGSEVEPLSPDTN